MYVCNFKEMYVIRNEYDNQIVIRILLKLEINNIVAPL